MSEKQTIEFTTMYGKFKGRAVIEDGVVTGSSPGIQSIIDSYMVGGRSAEEFVLKFRDNVTGYTISKLLEE